MHPLFTLLFDPTAGAAGFNLIACMFYIMIALAVLACVVERSFK